MVERLDAASRSAGVHRFRFRAADRAQGQMVRAGRRRPRGKAGAALLLTAAIYGDELNGIDVAIS